MGEIIFENRNAEGTRDYGTNCLDCERYKRVGEVCVLEHGKRHLSDYCRDFEPKVELPDYNELMKSVKQDMALQRQKEREKKERERKQKQKERAARKEERRRMRISRARKRYLAQQKKKEIARAKRKAEREKEKKTVKAEATETPELDQPEKEKQEISPLIRTSKREVKPPKAKKPKEIFPALPFSQASFVSEEGTSSAKSVKTQRKKRTKEQVSSS